METPLQSEDQKLYTMFKYGHNPCFSGNSFAIERIAEDGNVAASHNPCFSGNSFAIDIEAQNQKHFKKSQSLF